MSDQPEYFAKIGDQFVHESIECLTPNKKWAWRPTRDRIERAKKKYDLARQAKFKRILQNVKLQTGVME